MCSGTVTAEGSRPRTGARSSGPLPPAVPGRLDPASGPSGPVASVESRRRGQRPRRTSYPPLVNRATIFFAAGDAPRAAEDLTRALRISGDDPDVLLNRAIAYLACGDTPLALDDLDRALALPDADIAAIRSHRDACLALRSNGARE